MDFGLWYYCYCNYGTSITAQDVSSAEHINNQVALETTQTMMKIQATPRPLEMYDADGWKKYYVSGGYQYTYIGSGKGILHRTIQLTICHGANSKK